ncbi:MAG TPA: hypothetical protein VL985_07050, partial [Stellaceae bacterium]|nr:hypothetical protein [Stellaceae bacterium]
RDPCRRLISWYRFCQATPVTGEFADYIPVRLAHELDPSAFFEHQAIRSRTDANNAYLFYLSSLAVDPLTLDSVFLAYDGSTLRGPLPGSGTQAPGHMDKDILAPAVKQLLALDGIGITERFGESVELIFSALGLPIPESIAPMMVTDQLPNLAPGYSPVPPVEMTPRLSRALGPLTHYDRVIYNAAKREFERRLARRQEQPPILAAKDTLIPSGSMGS